MAKRPKEAKNAAVRLTVDDQVIVDRLKQRLGLDFSAVVKLAIRRLDEAESRREVAAD